jgi:hypothetical protein
MAIPTSANYVFLPWVREGAASGIQTPDSLTENQAGIVSVPVKLRVNDTDEINRQVRLYGPGDVTAIDRQQVIRTEPRHLATDFEPNYFPSVEFDRPDFPWLFTPAKADGQGRLRPWICLIVVRKQEGVSLLADQSRPLPVLEIKAPAIPKNELPDLSESWAWAHAQVTGSRRESDALKQSLSGDPALTVSRLLCPRRLDPLTDYLACVVPAFELGCKAALGMPIKPANQTEPGDEQKLAPAWVSGDQSPPLVMLPVYFHWEFRTGTGGDFEALVGLLKARDSQDFPVGIGKQQIDISRPGFRITPPLPEGTTLELEGALRIPEAPATGWPNETRSQFQAELKKVLDTPWLAAQQDQIEPLLAPPIYGCWQAARHIVEVSPVAPATLTWLDELNLDPRHRAVAGLGTAVIQSQQEQLMAAAWEQLGETERMNQMRRQAQLGRAVNVVYHAKHFSRFSEETLLKVVASAQSRIVVDATSDRPRALLSQRIAQSALPDRALSAPLRKLTNPRGVISSRFQPAGAPPIALVAKLNTFAPIIAQQQPGAGLVTISEVSDDQIGAFAPQLKQSVRFERVSSVLTPTFKLGDFRIVPEGSTPKRSLLTFAPNAAANSPEATAFLQAATAHQNYVALSNVMPFLFLSPQPMRLSETKSALLRSVDPEKTIAARVQASLGIAAATETNGDPLEPVLDSPEFPQPMYEALRDLSQEFLFPGLEHVPANTVTLLGTNPKFVESFLIGLNSEMDREFLWRNYPTDQRGTFFQQFWDTSTSNGQRDIEPIHTWDKKSKLGENARAGEKLVLLIRGELLRRYPSSVIYAVPAVPRGGQLDLSPDPQHERHPLFRGTLKPDVTFLGFNLTREEAVANPGWFFVIQQQPTEPSFGMDVADFEKSQPLTTWNDLSWRHLAATEGALKQLSHASVNTDLPDLAKAEWGRNSAHQAYITLQRPVRIAIHAREMLLKRV